MTIFARSIVFACLLTAVVSAQGGNDPVRLYNEAQSREATLRVELAAASAEPRLSLATRRRLRTLVGAYRDLARLFPTSGIADKALWQAAMLAGDTYTTWGDPTDRSAALRAFESLTGSYPNSSLARQVPAQTRRLWDVRVRTPEPAATATAAGPATPAAASVPAPVPPAPVAREIPAAAAASTTTAPKRDTSTPAEHQSAAAAPVTKPALRPPASAPAAVKTSTAATAVAAAPPAPAVPIVPAVAEAPQAPAVPLASLVAITHERVNGAVRITLQLDRETGFHSDSLVGPPRVFVDLRNTRMLERLRDAVIPVTDPVVQRIRVGRQPGNLTRVVLDLEQGHRYSAYSMYDPYRVVIDVEAPEAKATAAVETLTPPVTPAAAPKTPPAVVLAVATAPNPETKPVARATTRTAAAVTPAVSAATPAPSPAPQAAIVAAASAPAADAARVDDAPPLAPGVAASIAASAAVASPTDPPPSPPSTLAAHRTTAVERQIQANATPRRMQAGDATAAVNAIVATRPAATSASYADDAASPAEASAGIRPAPADSPVSGDAPAAGAPGSASKTARGDYSLSRQLGLGVARVVIDAGHGGHDPGAKVKGLTEAGLVLDIAQRLEVLLRRQPGVDVIMTRRSDTYVALEERTDMANRADADLFVSIHANASANPRARGVETYVLNFATSPEAETIAARENAGGSRTMRNLPDIVKTIATNNKLDESRELARFVQASLHNQLRKGDSTVRNLGVKQAPFMVLVGATMPAILTEVAFVTNQDDATHMKNEKYRQDVAEALLGGITRYQQSLKRTTAPAVAAQTAP